MGWIGCVCCEKFRHNFVARTFALVRPVLDQVFVRQPNGPQCTQIEQNTPKHQFRVQWGGSGAFVAKYSDATSCTNFCTSSARFAPSFITQPNGPQCTQI